MKKTNEMRSADCGVRNEKGAKGEGMRIADFVLRSSARGIRYSSASHGLPPHSTPLPGSHAAVRNPNSAIGALVCGWLALVLLVSGCAGPRPLRGGKAVTTRDASGLVQQTLVQGENPAQATRQDQNSVKMRSYTVPAGSRIVSDGSGDKGQVPSVTVGKCQVSGVTCQVMGTGSQPSSSVWSG